MYTHNLERLILPSMSFRLYQANKHIIQRYAELPQFRGEMSPTLRWIILDWEYCKANSIAPPSGLTSSDLLSWYIKHVEESQHERDQHSNTAGT